MENWQKEQKGILHSILSGETKVEKKEDSLLYTVPPEELIRLEVRSPKKTFDNKRKEYGSNLMDLRFEAGLSHDQIALLRGGHSIIVVTSAEGARKLKEAFEKGLIFKPTRREK